MNPFRDDEENRGAEQDHDDDELPGLSITEADTDRYLEEQTSLDENES